MTTWHQKVESLSKRRDAMPAIAWPGLKEFLDSIQEQDDFEKTVNTLLEKWPEYPRERAEKVVAKRLFESLQKRRHLEAKRAVVLPPGIEEWMQEE